MDMKEGCTRSRWNVTSLSPLVVTSFRFLYQTLRGFLRMMSCFSSPRSASQVHLTSFDENGLPSCHLTPGRSLNVSFVLSPFHDQLSARSGTILSALLIFSFGSNITRLLNTDMKGMFTEMVASSWTEALGGLSRWEMRSVPPCFWARAGDTATIKATAVPARNANPVRIQKILPSPRR